MKVKSGGFVKQQMKFKWDVFLSCRPGGWIVTAVHVRNITGGVSIRSCSSSGGEEVLCNTATCWLEYVRLIVSLAMLNLFLSLFFPHRER